MNKATGNDPSALRRRPLRLGRRYNRRVDLRRFDRALPGAPRRGRIETLRRPGDGDDRSRFRRSGLSVDSLRQSELDGFAVAPLFAVGGLAQPALQSLLSNRVGPDKQGELAGVLTSLSNLAAIGGPVLATVLHFDTKSIWLGAVWWSRPCSTSSPRRCSLVRGQQAVPAA